MCCMHHVAMCTHVGLAPVVLRFVLYEDGRLRNDGYLVCNNCKIILELPSCFYWSMLFTNLLRIHKVVVTCTAMFMYVILVFST